MKKWPDCLRQPGHFLTKIKKNADFTCVTRVYPHLFESNYACATMSSEKELNAVFDVLSIDHPAKDHYNIFKQESKSVRGGVTIVLGSRHQIFRNQEICRVTGYDEIDLRLP